MGLSSPGVGSNLDVNSIVTQLMAVEKRPLTLLDTQESTYQAQITAYGALNGALSSFQQTMQGLSAQGKFQALTAVPGDATVFTANAATGAAPGNYTINVDHLAQSQVMAAAGIADSQHASSTGTLSIRVGSGTQKTVTIDASNNTLAGVRDAINAAGAGVTAVIVNDGSATPYRLVLTADATGVANTIQVTNNLAAGELHDAVASLAQSRAPLDAALTVNSVAVASASNAVTGAIPGVTLNLLKSGATTLAVTRDAAAVKSSVSDFVKAYNDLNKTINGLTSYDASTKKAGLLLGDFATRNLQTQVRATLSQSLTGLGGGLTSLSQIGVSFQKDGSLALDSSKLTTAINSNFSDIAGLFAVQGKSSSTLMSFAGSGAASVAGAYGVDITVAATQGTITATNLPAASTVIDGTNDGVAVVVNGVASGALTLAHGTYTATELATALQAALDGSTAFAAAGVSARVDLTGGGAVRITSAAFGSGATVADASGTAALSLGFDGTETGAGLDVAGNFILNGVSIAATGAGQYLTGVADTAAAGIKIQFTGTQVQGGVDATLNFSQGYASKLSQLASTMLEDDGALASRTDGIGKSIANIGARRDAVNRRLVDVEARYRAQFSALDTLINNLNSTSSFLTQQLANMPTINSSK